MPISEDGYHKFLLLVDEASKFVVTSAMKDETAKSIKKVIDEKWIPYFGLPANIHSDQGGNVDGNVVRTLCDSYNIEKSHSSPYHPEGNGLAERNIGAIKTSISSVLNARKLSVHSWDTVLAECTLAHNNITNQSNGFSPAMLLLGSNTRMPIDNFMKLEVQQKEEYDRNAARTNAQLNQKESRLGYKERYDKSSNVSIDFKVGDKVLLRRTAGDYPKISVNWKCDSNDKPYEISKRIGPVNYAVKNCKGIVKVYHRNMLAPALESCEAKNTLSNLQTNIPINTNNPKLVIPISTSIPSATAGQMLDVEGFSRNVFSRGPQGVVNDGAESEPIRRTRYGRIVRPVNRLLEEM